MVFESVIVDILNKYLKPYVQRLDSSQLNLGVWKGAPYTTVITARLDLFIELYQLFNWLLFDPQRFDPPLWMISWIVFDSQKMISPCPNRCEKKQPGNEATCTQAVFQLDHGRGDYLRMP